MGSAFSSGVVLLLPARIDINKQTFSEVTVLSDTQWFVAGAIMHHGATELSVSRLT